MSRPALAVTTPEGKRFIKAQIKRGREFLQRRPRTKAARLQYAIDVEEWSAENARVLRRVFQDGDVATEYDERFPAESIIDDDEFMPADEIRGEIEFRISFLDVVITTPKKQSSTAKVLRRIFVSLPADEWLSKLENDTKWAIVSAIEAQGYAVEIFLDPRGTSSLAASRVWSADRCEEVMRRCEGCVLLGFPRWRFPGSQGSMCLATEFNQYEGAVAHTLGLPLLVLVQEGVARRVVFDANYKGWVGIIPGAPAPAWLETKEFQTPFKYWRDELSRRRDVFLGYCGASKPVARQIKRLLEQENRTVLDWAADFDPAKSILSQIEEAAHRCGAGVFLFTRDDQLAKPKGKDIALPRDNVVFEAGFFAATKGKSRVLIVREAGTKMPADLGGDIYASLERRDNIEAIIPTLRKFLDAL